jgi:hypothetical protein
MTKTITITVYPTFTEKDLVTMLQLRPGERDTLSNGYVAERQMRTDEIEVEVEKTDYEVDE